MPGVLFGETLRRGWRQMLYWGLGLGLFGFYILLVIPDVEALQEYAALLETLPPVLLQVFGAQDAAALATPEGFIGLGYFSYAVLLLAVYAIMAGLNITANEEEAGILDVLLSLPIPRWRVIVERFAAGTLIAAGVIASGFAGLWIGLQFSALQIDSGRMLAGSINLLPVTLLIMAVTTCAATLTRRRALALAVTVIFLVASYFIDFLASAISHAITAALSRLSFFTYYDSQHVMVNGLNPLSMLILLAAALMLIAAALWFFRRRDIGV